MEHLPIFETVQETADALENEYDELQQLCDELRALVEDTPDKWGLPGKVKYTVMTPYKGKGEPRWMQMGNALSALQAGVGALQEALPDEDEKASDDENEARNELEGKLTEVEDKWQEVEGVEFPSMFG